MEAPVTEVLPLDALPVAPRYFPIERGRYEVKPGLYPLGKVLAMEFGSNGFFRVTATTPATITPNN